MPVARRTAETEWTGDTKEGSGEITFTSSGAAGPLPISLGSRTDAENRAQTNPEELIAAAHSGCYAMAFSHYLTEQGNPPERLHVSSRVVLDAVGDGLGITKSELTVEGSVPGFDQDKFAEAAAEAEKGCPVSNALRGSVEITLDAKHS